MARTTWVLGFTGAVGAGCSTATQWLENETGYARVRLSDPVRAAWSQQNPDTTPTRQQLQTIGDDLRSAHGAAVLVSRALEGVSTDVTDPPVVVDGIRNLGEVEFLRDHYGHRFLLIGVLASKDTRWKRICDTEYRNNGLTLADFTADDQRDQGEDASYGQQVGLCVDAADAIIDNGGDVTRGAYLEKVRSLAELLTGASSKTPTPDEIRMHTAFSQSHSSRCIKRHVGAVIAGPDGEIVGVGYNENPLSTNPCIDEPEYNHTCFRDIVRNRQYKVLVEKEVTCPTCGAPLEAIVGPPWRCDQCQSEGRDGNLEPFFFPERAMNWCTAIHAEDRALRQAGERARGGIVYTTTFPCFGCAEKIISAGIARVIFTEPYPDSESSLRLSMANIQVEQFEGVRSSAFERVFGARRPT